LISRMLYTFSNRDSSVGIVIGYRLYIRGLRARYPAGATNFCLLHSSKV